MPRRDATVKRCLVEPLSDPRVEGPWSFLDRTDSDRFLKLEHCCEPRTFIHICWLSGRTKTAQTSWAGQVNSRGRAYSHIKFATCRDLFDSGHCVSSSLIVLGVNEIIIFMRASWSEENHVKIRRCSRSRAWWFSGPKSSCTPKCTMTSVRRNGGSRDGQWYPYITPYS